MTVPGIDISSWQPTTPSLAGLDFVIPRATYGTRPDAKYAQHVAVIRAAGLVQPAYHFGTGVSAPEVQLAAFLSVASAADAYVLDLEAERGKTPMSLAQARAFITGAKRTGKKTLLYHSESGFPNLGQDGNWPAHWGVATPTMASWVLHQYRGSPLDLDRFNGNLAQLRAWFGKVAPKPVIVRYHLRFTGGAFWVYTSDGKPFTDSRGVRYGGTITGRRAQSFGAPTGAYSGPSAPYAWSRGTRYLARVKGGPLDRQLVAIAQSTVKFEVQS